MARWGARSYYPLVDGMDRYDMEGEPEYTCPLIDETIDKLDALRRFGLEGSWVDELEAQLEKIRTANEELREWGRAGHSALEALHMEWANHEALQEDVT